MRAKDKTKSAAVLTAAALTLLCAASLLFLLLSAGRGDSYTAEIYRNGELIASIPLSEVREPSRLTVTGENGCRNEIEVRPGSIGVISADCPEQLCVRQGFVSSSVLPITCLPNRLVILLRPAAEKADKISPDIITY